MRERRMLGVYGMEWEEVIGDPRTSQNANRARYVEILTRHAISCDAKREGK